MADPLLMFFARNASQRAARHRRRRPLTELPHEDRQTDAIFIVLRRLRVPLLALLAIFTVAVVGLAAIPGNNSHGEPGHLTIFEAFYFVSYTAATIGFGELGSFTTAQRMWVTVTIYSSVIGWAYAIGTLLTLVQDASFQEAVRTQRFRRRVSALTEPFYLIAGYGQAGRIIADELDDDGHRLVVLDKNQMKIDKLYQHELHSDVPGLDVDVRHPASLVSAGLLNPHCRGLVAVTDSDEANLAALMTASLARPELTTFARAQDRVHEARMLDFGPEAVINPGDLFGAYLMLALQRPASYELISRLMSTNGRATVTNRGQLKRGHWLVVSDDTFGDEITSDLQSAGNQVVRHSPSDHLPDLTHFVGVVAGSRSDTTNIAIAERTHTFNPDIFSAVRQESAESSVLLEPLGVNAVFNPNTLVASEILARITSPMFWTFVQEAIGRDEAWSQTILDRLDGRCEEGVELERELLKVSRKGAPALHRAVADEEITLDAMLRDPDDRAVRSAIVPLVLSRGKELVCGPPMDTVLQQGDQLLLVGSGTDLDHLGELLHYDSSLAYVLTGHEVPNGWLFRVAGSGRRHARETRSR